MEKVYENNNDKNATNKGEKKEKNVAHEDKKAFSFISDVLAIPEIEHIS